MKLTIDEVLTRGVETILPDRASLKKLMQSKKITVYQGFDPSMPSLHLGNLTGIIKLSQFQRLGHKVIFLIGDFTGMIGDPTDKLSVRKNLSREEVIKNSKNWRRIVSKFLDLEGKNKAEILYNSSWSDKLTFKDLIEITSKFTVQQMIERDMFQKRLELKKPIYLHEFLYPVAQAIDSVFMDVDLEIGGSDQLFNMLAGRTLMQAMKNKEKYVLTTRLLVDKKGNKVGKTTGNAVFLDSTPNDIFGAIMSFPDEVILLGFEILTELPLEGLSKKIKTNPMDEKKRLAYEVVKNLYTENQAKKAREFFERTYQLRKPIFDTEVKAGQNLALTIAPFTLRRSISEAKRYLKQGAVDVNGKVQTNPNFIPQKGDKIKVGERVFLKVV